MKTAIMREANIESRKVCTKSGHIICKSTEVRLSEITVRA